MFEFLFHQPGFDSSGAIEHSVKIDGALGPASGVQPFDTYTEFICEQCRVFHARQRVLLPFARAGLADVDERTRGFLGDLHFLVRHRFCEAAPKR